VTGSTTEYEYKCKAWDLTDCTYGVKEIYSDTDADVYNNIEDK